MPAYKVQQLKSDPRMSICSELVLSRLRRCDSQALSNACYAHAILGHGSPALIEGEHVNLCADRTEITEAVLCLP